MSAKNAAERITKSWHGRLTAEADESTSHFLASLDVDRALWRHDIAGSIAHARMLAKVGLLTAAEFNKIHRGLRTIASDIQAGRLDMPVELEDIHMVIEKALIDRIGGVGGKLHTGRSRNDQVALDLRLWAREAIDRLLEGIVTLQRTFVDLAHRQGAIVMPAYTHLQRAQPIVAGHALLAYVEMLQRDADRMTDARRRANVCPLGSGAVAGTSLPLDRTITARELGFDEVSRNSIDATSDRDFLAELCFACAMLGVHLSRWAEDWIIFATTEFGFLQLHEAYCTSSSMMPQKKNPDTLELIRAKSAAAIAQLVGILSLLKGLPMGYNRDLQDDKRFAFAAAATMQGALAVAAGIVSTAQFDQRRIASGLTQGFLDATALAEYLVGKGVPFRQAHGIVGRLVRATEKQGAALGQLSLTTLQDACPRIGRDVFARLGSASVTRRYTPQGAGGPKQLRRQLVFWKRKLSGKHARV